MFNPVFVHAVDVLDVVHIPHSAFSSIIFTCRQCSFETGKLHQLLPTEACYSAHKLQFSHMWCRRLS